MTKCNGNEEWCENLDGGFVALLAVASGASLTGSTPFVHECGRPAWLIWQKAERYCDECGRSFSGPHIDDLCPRHGGQTWSDAWQQTKEICAKRIDA